MARDELRKNAMMAHLMDALNQGKDVGHYGRLVFAMVGRFFLDEDDVVAYLAKNPGVGEVQARALYREVHAYDYNPPKRERISSPAITRPPILAPGQGDIMRSGRTHVFQPSALGPRSWRRGWPTRL
jgi:hypothetical protein